MHLKCHLRRTNVIAEVHGVTKVACGHADVMLSECGDSTVTSTVLRGVGQFNTLRPEQDGCQFPDDIFKYIFLNENI